jgi:hypothetical protein
LRENIGGGSQRVPPVSSEAKRIYFLRFLADRRKMSYHSLAQAGLVVVLGDHQAVPGVRFDHSIWLANYRAFELAVTVHASTVCSLSKMQMGSTG